MKAILMSVTLLLTLIPVFSQEEKPSNKKTELETFVTREAPNLGKMGIVESKYPSELYYNTPYDGGLLGTATIPINFSKISYDVNTKNVTIDPNLSVGIGYTFFFGDFTFMEDGKIKVNPYFMFGPAINVGVSVQSTIVKPNLVLGLFLGFQNISLYSGYDFLANQFVLGIGAKLDFFTVDSSSFNVFGEKVRPLYGYKSDAKLINTAWKKDPPTE